MVLHPHESSFATLL